MVVLQKVYSYLGFKVAIAAFFRAYVLSILSCMFGLRGVHKAEAKARSE